MDIKQGKREWDELRDWDCHIYTLRGGSDGKEFAGNGNAVIIPWVRKIPWRRECLPTPVFLPGESPWTEEPEGLQFMGLQRIGHDWMTNTHFCLKGEGTPAFSLAGWLGRPSWPCVKTPHLGCCQASRFRCPSITSHIIYPQRGAFPGRSLRSLRAVVKSADRAAFLLLLTLKNPSSSHLISTLHQLLILSASYHPTPHALHFM